MKSGGADEGGAVGVEMVAQSAVRATEYAALQTTEETHVEEHAAVQSPEIAWSGVSFHAKKKVILSSCWGKVKTGQMAIILGPSGAGKSTLLNVLAGRSSSSSDVTVEGKITVDGKLINPIAFRKHIAYVMQESALFHTATPRESLAFSAAMRLPPTYTRSEIASIVEQILQDLHLGKCADTMIGDVMHKGISGGERKRTCIGIELVTKPSLLFLDEPTSGLDSTSAIGLVALLQAMSRSSCTILATIHQPSSQIFTMFDVSIFMKEGRIMYFGAPRDAANYYAQFGYVVPKHHNPADFIMMLCNTITNTEAVSKGVYMAEPKDMEAAASIKLVGKKSFVVHHSFYRQLVALTHREFICVQRDKTLLIARYGITLLLNIIYGLIFLGAADEDNGDLTTFAGHYGAVTMILVATMMPVLITFPYERPIFMREYANGAYGVVAYVLGKLAIEAPMTLIQVLEILILQYFMMGLQGNFIYFVLVAWALSMSASSLALTIGCAVTAVKQASEMSPALFTPQIAFSGFFIRLSQVPVFLRWAQYLCALKYATNLFLINEFHPSQPSCKTSPSAEDNCRSILVGNDIDVDSSYVYIVLLLALFVGFRVIGAMILVHKAQRFY